YDGDGDIDCVLVGVAHIGFLTAMPNGAGARQFMTNGWTPAKWESYVYSLLGLYRAAFPRTRLYIRGSRLLISIPEPKAYGFENAPLFNDVRDRILVRAAEEYRCNVGFNGLAPDPEQYLETGVPQLLARLAPGAEAGRYALEVADDWPMWVPRERRGNKKRYAMPDESDASMNAYFVGCLRNAIGGERGIPRSGISFMKALETELEATRPGGVLYQDECFQALKWARAQMMPPKERTR
ncbi:MAG: hypothetical protein ACE5JM_15150, partial [Armatimonadota bacterium]